MVCYKKKLLSAEENENPLDLPTVGGFSEGTAEGQGHLSRG